VAAVEEGNYSRALGDRLAELECQQELFRTRLKEAPPSIVRLHPGLAEVYAEKVQQLETSLNDPAIRDESADVFRSLIDHIELHPRNGGESVDAITHGDLAEIPLWGNTWHSLGQAIVGGPFSPRADELAHYFQHVLSIQIEIYRGAYFAEVYCVVAWKRGP